MTGLAPVARRLADELLERCRFPDVGTEVTCAVSGGADSLALLLLSVVAGLRPTAVHVDHGLRPGSEREADVVAAAACRFGAAFHAERVDVEAGPNLEARARAARYAALPDDVLTGHTADDQAETVLLNLLRGSGLDGLAGMRPDRRRPLLGLRRSDTGLICEQAGLDVVDDPSNHDPAFRRNRVRHELLPLMADISERDPVPLLARLAGHLRSDADLLDNLAASVDPTDSTALRDAAGPLAARSVRRWLQDQTRSPHPPDAGTVERVLDVARGIHRSTDVGRGRRVARTRGRLRVDPPGDH